MKEENQSNYESMSLRGRRDFLQSLVGLAAVAVLPVPVGIALDRKPYPYAISWKLNMAESNDIIVIYDGLGKEIYRKA